MFDNAIGTVDFPGGRFDVSYSSDEVTLSNFQAVPEPGSLSVFAIAAADSTALAAERMYVSSMLRPPLARTGRFASSIISGERMWNRRLP